MSDEERRIDCLRRFREAVADGKRGVYGKAKALIASVKDRFGEKQAEIARTELWAAIKSDNRKWN